MRECPHVADGAVVSSCTLSAPPRPAAALPSHLQGLVHLLDASTAGFVVGVHSMSPRLQTLLSTSVLYVSAHPQMSGACSAGAALPSTCPHSSPCLACNLDAVNTKLLLLATTLCPAARSLQGGAQ